MILKQVADTRYTVISSRSFEVDIQDENIIYINSIQNIYWMPQMPPVIFARGPLISDLLNDGNVPGNMLDLESFKLVWSYIIKNIYYDKVKYSNISNLIGYVPDLELTYKDNKGICYDYASFMACLLRSFGIPAKLVTGYCPTYYGSSYHAWNQVFIGGRWITVDPTYDAVYYRSGYDVNYKKDSDLYDVSKVY
jgi:transglutaminase/protease-like cytokinesis protein 3